MSALNRKITRRKGLRASANALRKQIDELLTAFSEESRVNILGLQSTLNEQVNAIKLLDEEITAGIPPEEIETDIMESSLFYIDINTTLASISLKTVPSNPPSDNGSRTASLVERSTVRLPKIELTKFSGNPVEWQSFWDQFQSAVHQNETLSNIDKFNYLKRYLVGSALSTVSGLALTNENYENAITLLKDRFGNKQILINAHMETLLKLEKVRSIESTRALRKLYNDVENCVRNLKSLNYDSNKLCLLIPILNERLPNELRMIISRKFGNEVWTVESMLKYVNEELQARERCLSNEKSERNVTSSSSRFTTECFLSENEKSYREKCVFCLRNHSSSKCSVITNVQARKNILKKYAKCFLCLKTGHLIRNCTSNYSCNKCGKRHNIAICESIAAQNNAGETPTGEVFRETTTSYTNGEKGILLQTARAFVSKNKYVPPIQTRILFDSGSQRTYITSDLKEKLNLPTIRKESLLINTFGFSNTEIKEFPVVRIFVKITNNYFQEIEAVCVPNICKPIRDQNINFCHNNYNHLQNLRLADYSDGSNAVTVQILIGLDYYYSFISGKVIKGRAGPVAVQSKLGWILCGGGSPQSESNCFETHSMKCSTDVTTSNDRELQSELRKFWEVESVCESDDVMLNFERSIYFNGERYVTELPFRPDHDPLPDNFIVSKNRLQSLVKRRLKNDTVLCSNYDDIFIDYEEKGIIERVPECEISKDKDVYYLPHHPVIRHDKDTTKVRVVFDGSCNTLRPSLNDVLYSGPNLLTKIFDVLLRFRTNYIAIVADIQQAFLNVEISEADKDFLRFLWIEDPTEEQSRIIFYRFLRVVFGLTCSPFLLNGTIRHHLQKYIKTELEFVEKFLRDLYVDDVISGSKSIAEGKKFYNIAKKVMNEAGFNLRKWDTNDRELKTFFNEQENIVDVPTSSALDDSTFVQTQFSSGSTTGNKVLGIEWDVQTDNLIFRFDLLLQKAHELPPTKRNVLRISASFYDPLGIIAPVTTRVKVMFQLLCRNKFNWDDPIDGETLNEWNGLLNELDQIKTVQIPRYSFCEPNHNILSIELHGFSDSSKLAYASVIYARIKTNIGIRVSLLAAKTKVAPLKPVSIPRLELLGCVLLSKLLRQVRKAFEGNVKVERCICWSDSEVVLCWLKGKSRDWKPWVENRVVFVRSVLSSEFWFYVSTSQNPADIPTRPSLFRGFENCLWFSGPKFLYDDVILEPSFDVEERIDLVDVVSEAKKVHVVTTIVHTHSTGLNLHNILNVNRFSTLNKLIVTTGYVYRFTNNLLHRIGKRETRIYDKELSSDEYNFAYNKLIITEQNLLQSDERYFKKLSDSLKLFTADDGMQRLRGRYAENFSLSYDEKYPVILPSESELTRLIIFDAHVKMHHQGVEATLNKVRSSFWIIKGRRTVKNILRKCVVCKRFQGKTMSPPNTPDLPDYRLTASRAFETTGFDHAGPLMIKDPYSSSLKKVYVLLLTCAASRAVHFELSPDLKSDAFIRAFKRFKSRRGTPKIVVHDNFKTFRSSKVKRYFNELNIQSKPILPASPWWGGFYERLVRSMKTSLKKTLGRSLITFEELETVLCDVEESINNRPLFYMSEDDIGRALTPMHLIYGQNPINSRVSESNHTNEIQLPQDCIKRERRIRTMIAHQWRRFRSTYLNELREQHNYAHKSRTPTEINVNDVVIVTDDKHTSRASWRLGRVIQLVYGKDGNVRGAKLIVVSDKNTPSTIFRPVQKLILLEISRDVQDNVSVEGNDDVKVTRSKRRAAKDGETLRRLKEMYM